MKRTLIRLLCSLLTVLTLCTATAASEAPAWGRVQENAAILYLPGGQKGNYSCQIGSVEAQVQSVTPLNELDPSVETIILIDNSLSVKEDQRPRIKELLNALIDSQMAGELYTIGTIADQVNYMCNGIGDPATLKTLVDALSFQKQDTQLMDGLYNVLNGLKGSEDGLFRRLLIVADGMDDKQVGYTPSELAALIQELGYPIYTVGCASTSSSTEALQSLFALSRITYGSAYYYLPEVEAVTDIVTGVASWDNSVQMTVQLPPEVCDGMPKALRITGESGDIYTTELKMPLGAIPEPTAEQTTQPAPITTPTPEPEPEPDSNVLLWVVLALAIVLVIAAAVTVTVLLLRKKKKNERFEVVEEAKAPVFVPEVTEMITDNGDRTEGIWDSAPGIRLVFQNLDMPSQRIEAALSGELLVGRDASKCQVVLTEASVAREQCRIFRRGSWVMLSNLSHSNITKLDGRMVTEECELPSGSTLQMGRVRMRVDILS